MKGMKRTLERRGVGPVEIFAYNSSGVVPLEQIAREFVDFCGEGEVQVAAHSMGGLVVRTAKVQFPEWKVKKAAFLCVPHRGSWMANLLPLPGVRQMVPGSPLLRQLDAAGWSVPTLAVWCPGDLLVMPGSSARLSTAEKEIRCDFPLHNWPVVAPRFHRAVADFFLNP